MDLKFSDALSSTEVWKEPLKLVKSIRLLQVFSSSWFVGVYTRRAADIGFLDFSAKVDPWFILATRVDAPLNFFFIEPVSKLQEGVILWRVIKLRRGLADPFCESSMTLMFSWSLDYSNLSRLSFFFIRVGGLGSNFEFDVTLIRSSAMRVSSSRFASLTSF